MSLYQKLRRNLYDVVLQYNTFFSHLSIPGLNVILVKMEWTPNLRNNYTTSIPLEAYVKPRNGTQPYIDKKIAEDININITQSDIHSFHTATSLAYSGYKKDLAPWLTGLIFALVVVVILIPAFCSACYHYYR